MHTGTAEHAVLDAKLERVKVLAKIVVNDAFVFDSDVTFIADFCADQWIGVMKSWLAGERIMREEVVYPATWLDALLEAILPSWLARRYVRHHRVVIDVTALYPDLKLKVALPDEPVIFDLRRRDWIETEDGTN